MRQSRIRSRRGWMLMEAIVVIAALSLIMASGVSLIGAVWKTYRAIMTDSANGRSLRLLAQDFRRDLQRATSVELNGDSSEPRLVIVDVRQNRIEYLHDTSGIHRITKAQNGDISREIFRLQGTPVVSWTSPQINEGPLDSPAGVQMHVALRPANAPHKDTPGDQELRIVGWAPLVTVTEESPHADD